MIYILPSLYYVTIYCCIHVKLWSLWPTHLVTPFPVHSTVYPTFPISPLDDLSHHLLIPQLGNSVPVHSTVHPVLAINYGAGLLSQGWGRAWKKTYPKSMARLGQERDPQRHAPIFTTSSRYPSPQYNHFSLTTIAGRLYMFHIIQNGWPPSGNTHIGTHKPLYYWYVFSYQYY